jgi:hypothetical protein
MRETCAPAEKLWVPHESPRIVGNFVEDALTFVPASETAQGANREAQRPRASHLNLSRQKGGWVRSTTPRRCRSVMERGSARAPGNAARTT